MQKCIIVGDHEVMHSVLKTSAKMQGKAMNDGG
jgi:hypothetical protein